MKEQDEALDKAVIEHYPNLTEAEVKEIVVHNKWLASLETMIAEANRRFAKPNQTVEELAERYETPAPVQKQLKSFR